MPHYYLSHTSDKHEAAEALEQCALRFRKKALDVVKSTKVAQMLGPEAVPPSGTVVSDPAADDVRIIGRWIKSY